MHKDNGLLSPHGLVESMHTCFLSIHHSTSCLPGKQKKQTRINQLGPGSHAVGRTHYYYYYYYYYYFLSLNRLVEGDGDGPDRPEIDLDGPDGAVCKQARTF